MKKETPLAQARDLLNKLRGARCAMQEIGFRCFGGEVPDEYTERRLVGMFADIWSTLQEVIQNTDAIVRGGEKLMDFYPDPKDKDDDRIDRGPYSDTEATRHMGSVPPSGPGMPPRDENPSAECQMLRERVAVLSEIEKRAAAVAQWADATWIGHPARMDVYVLRGALDRASGSDRTVLRVVAR